MWMPELRHGLLWTFLLLPFVAAKSAFTQFDQPEIAVYYGHTPGTQETSLRDQCLDPSITIVILSYVRSFNHENTGYPLVDLGPICGNASQAAPWKKEATGLVNCSRLEPVIRECQKTGTKVLMSVGGPGKKSNTTFESSEDAEYAAVNLWNLFGGGSDEKVEMRPFGSVKLDGFDLANEQNDTAFYDVFASTLSSLFQASGSTYYLSASPSCALPSRSLPAAVFKYTDFVWVRFYNATSCSLGTSGFLPSLRNWSGILKNLNRKSKLFLGAKAFDDEGEGYVETERYGELVEEARHQNLSNWGGVMLWDGNMAQRNVDQDGEDYVEVTREALTSGAARRVVAVGSVGAVVGALVLLGL